MKLSSEIMSNVYNLDQLLCFHGICLSNSRDFQLLFLFFTVLIKKQFLNTDIVIKLKGTICGT